MTIIENTTQHLITIVVRRKVDHVTAENSEDFEHRRIDLKPGMNELTDDQAALVDAARRASKITARRFDARELVVTDRGRSRDQIFDQIRKTIDADALRRMRSETTDKALLEVIEEQLDAVTRTTDGEPTAPDVRRRAAKG